MRMWPRFRIVLLVVILAGPLVSALAHHSLDAEFNREMQFHVTGRITKVEWMNPHAWLFIDVNDSGTARVTRWALQLPSPNMLYRLGWDRDPFKPGIVVTVDGYRAKDGSPRGTVQEVVSSEGKKLYVRSSS